MKVLGFLGLFCSVCQLVVAWYSPLWLGTSTVCGCLLYVVSFTLFWWAVPYARRGRLAIAFATTSPTTLVTDGPYRYVRHPFYAAYMTFWLAGSLATSQLVLFVPVIVMGALYWRAILWEERAFAAGPLAARYAEYARCTGELFPKFSQWSGIWGTVDLFPISELT